MHDFVIQDFVIKRGVICAGPCVYVCVCVCVFFFFIKTKGKNLIKESVKPVTSEQTVTARPLLGCQEPDPGDGGLRESPWLDGWLDQL